jgi:23S rRNA (adenine2503-C2)-methyltransferase
LRKALDTYALATGGSIFIEYLMLAGINDSPEQARSLATYLRGLPVKINLIPYNDTSIPGLSASSTETIGNFRRILVEDGYFVHLRHSKGNSALGACGQLASR